VIVPHVPVVDTVLGDIAAIVGDSRAAFVAVDTATGVIDGEDGDVVPPQPASPSAASAAANLTTVIEPPFFYSLRR
jgi:hypothetical protein